MKSVEIFEHKMPGVKYVFVDRSIFKLYKSFFSLLMIYNNKGFQIYRITPCRSQQIAIVREMGSITIYDYFSSEFAVGICRDTQL